MNKAFSPAARRPEPSARFTAADFLRMLELGAFEDIGAELVGGVIEKMMPAFMNHGEYNARLVVKLAEAYRGGSFRLATDLVVQIDDMNVRAADIAIARPELPGDRPATGPDLVLVVEIADTSLARDLGSKAVDYARAGVPTYWVLDLKARVVHVMTEAGATGYERVDVVRFGEPLAPPGAGQQITMD